MLLFLRCSMMGFGSFISLNVEIDGGMFSPSTRIDHFFLEFGTEISGSTILRGCEVMGGARDLEA
jgi:hypothetical protein